MGKAASRLLDLRNDALEILRWQCYRCCCPLIRKAMQRMPTDELDYSIHISPSYRYVYMDNPKTGCSSLKSALIELETRHSQYELDVYNWRNLHNRGVSPLLQLGDTRSPAPLSDLVRKGFRFVTFVRNPYARLLSGYRDKMHKHTRMKAEILRLLGHAETDLDRPISFEDFVKTVVRQTDRQMNPHWRPQTAQILYGILDYHFIGRFEHYHRDFPALFESLGIPTEQVPALRHINRTKDGPGEDCRTYYTEELRELVLTRYHEDFINFGYGEDVPE